MEMRLHRADWNIQRLGERIVLDAFDIVRGNQESVAFGQLRDRFVEPIAQLEFGEGAVGSAPFKDRLRSRPLRRPTTPGLAAHVGDNAENPRGQTRLSPEIWQTAIELQEHG